MAAKLDNDNDKKNPQNYVEKSKEEMILDEAQKELEKLRNSFSKEKNYDNEHASNKLDEINNLIHENEKKEFKKALDDLKDAIINSKEQDKEQGNQIIEENFNEVVNLLDKLIQNELNNLKKNVQYTQTWNNTWRDSRPPKRSIEVRKGIEDSSENISKLIENAKNDKSWFVRNVIARLLEWANS